MITLDTARRTPLKCFLNGKIKVRPTLYVLSRGLFLLLLWDIFDVAFLILVFGSFPNSGSESVSLIPPGSKACLQRFIY